MIEKQLENIDADDILGLLSEKVPESRTLDYKQDVDTRDAAKKRDFLFDICAFANTQGGDIIIGISEQTVGKQKTGLPQAIVGMSGTGDERMRSFQQMIQSHIRPRLTVGLREITTPNGSVIVIRIPQSYAAPHMVTLDDINKFYRRASGTQYAMDVDEIREAFARSESLPSRIRGFREHRLEQIRCLATPTPMTGVSKMVLHVLPISAFTRPIVFQLRANELRTLTPIDVPPLHFRGRSSSRHNFDGVLVEEWELDTHSTPLSQFCRRYVQMFRSGMIESVVSIDNQLHCIPVWHFIRTMYAARQYLNLLRMLGVTLPLYLCLSLINIREYHLAFASHELTDEAESLGQAHPFDRADLILPECHVDNFDTPVHSMLAPAMDVLWQAGGFERCFLKPHEVAV